MARPAAPRPTPALAAIRGSSVKPGFGSGNPDPGITHEVDPDFLEHLRREAIDQPELPWEPWTRAEHADFSLATAAIIGDTMPMLPVDGRRALDVLEDDVRNGPKASGAPGPRGLVGA